MRTFLWHNMLMADGGKDEGSVDPSLLEPICGTSMAPWLRGLRGDQ